MKLTEIIIRDPEIAQIIMSLHKQGRPFWHDNKPHKLHTKPELVGSGDSTALKFTLYSIGLS